MRFVKSEAKELMLAGENHLLLIFSILIVGVTAVVPQYLFGLIYMFFPYAFVDKLLLALTCILEAPFVYGLLRIAMRISNGERCTLADLFEAYSSIGEFWRSLVLVASVILVSCIETFAIALPIAVANVLKSSATTSELAATVIKIVGVVAVGIVLLWFNSRILPFPMLYAKGSGIFGAIGRSLRITKKRSFDVLCLQFSLLPLVAVSVIAVLVPLIIYTLPYLICIYAIGVNELCENNNE